VAAHDFFFALEFSSQGASASLLGDLAARVLGHVGCSPEDVPALADALEKAVAKGAYGGERRCDLQFRAGNGTLEILVSANGGRIWQTSRSIP
jgi:hypothetical protein